MTPFYVGMAIYGTFSIWSFAYDVWVGSLEPEDASPVHEFGFAAAIIGWCGVIAWWFA